ncbi:MAG: hypothetical protein P0Y48_02950 [Candidatus Microbacterium phytovorans]|uniref:Uncharacterized protein n=1 Tax=Candidatus Microbacterium phytovorans TaxID=3121374 RepID=A0AAJ5W143_9MICO|nr:hypothetical protein [Microbacterium sp.]WEK14186.1 MAG: hypothetical protein P0Y48_02950 [Microbacterium sp.]
MTGSESDSLPTAEEFEVDEGLQRMIVNNVLRGIANEMVLTGEVDPSRLTLDQLLALAFERMKDNLRDGVEFAMVVDHSSTILAEARSYADGGREEFAFVFYGLFIEHVLNRAIRDRSTQLGLSERETVELMRRSVPDKTGLTWKLLFGEDFPALLRSDIRFISERRNSFAHYKWQDHPESHLLPDAIRTRREKAETTAERAASTLEDYVRRLFTTDGDVIDHWLHGPHPTEESQNEEPS